MSSGSDLSCFRWYGLHTHNIMMVGWAGGRVGLGFRLGVGEGDGS